MQEMLYVSQTEEPAMTSPLPAVSPKVTAFFDTATNTVSYVVQDPDGSACAIVDSVLDFDHAAGRTDTSSADPKQAAQR